jgi:hypothetical protein
VNAAGGSVDELGMARNFVIPRSDEPQEDDVDQRDVAPVNLPDATERAISKPTFARPYP